MKTKIDLYLIKAENFMNGFPFVCQLIEKVYFQELELLVNIESEIETEQMDQLLWTFKETSFIPHQIQNPKQIFIGKSNTISPKTLILNCYLSNTPEPIVGTRLLQIVPNDPQLLQLARQHYRFYQGQGYEISTHHLKEKNE